VTLIKLYQNSVKLVEGELSESCCPHCDAAQRMVWVPVLNRIWDCLGIKVLQEEPHQFAVSQNRPRLLLAGNRDRVITSHDQIIPPF
jgi:hypothetical protein